MKTFLIFIFLFANMGSLLAQDRVQKMPNLKIQGVSHSQNVVAFAVNGKAPLISSGSQAMVSWVNGRSATVLSIRNQAQIPAFEYVVSNIQFVRYETNYVVLLAFPGNMNQTAYLSRQLNDPRCPSVPPERDLGYNPNEGCRAGTLSPFMGNILGFIPIERIVDDPAAKRGEDVVLKRGEDF
jgi:hypothetical protein